ncbi:MAG: hypothetical protein R2843_08795 [Thermomicrobiales bacterium]
MKLFMDRRGVLVRRSVRNAIARGGNPRNTFLGREHTREEVLAVNAIADLTAGSLDSEQ